MRVFYQLSRYLSHRKAGREYIRAISALDVELVKNPESADVVILHDEPPAYHLYYEAFPSLREKHVIACAVWETDILPEVYIDALQLVNEVWTCSEFTHSVFARHFDNVYKIPYVVSAPEVTAADALATQDMLRYDPEVYYFYTIADSVNPRKNLSATVEAFLQPRPAACRKAVLVIKQYRKALPHLSSLPNVISISEMVPDGVMGALHRTCDCYVSSHCAEAWGLSISDAMAFGNAAIATGYSGNTEYMSDRNAFPVKFELTNIREEDLRFQPRLLSAHMHWAYIDVNDLASKMVHCLENPDIGSRRHQATQLVHEYSHERVGGLIEERLAAI